MCAITRGRNCTYEEWINKGVSDHNKLVPIECVDGIQSKTIYAAGNRSKLDVLRRNPSDPVEVRHRLKDVVGEPEVDKHGDEAVREPPHSGDCPAISNAIGLGVECAVEGDGCQVGGPDRLGRIDEESTGETGKTISDKVCGQGHEN